MSEFLAKIRQIQPYDSYRWETTDGLDNPDCTNGVRVDFAAKALDSFQNACGMNEAVDIATADLIGDLLHLVHSFGYEPLAILESALEHFSAEAGAPEPD
jgi:hypothetical protein